MKKFMFVLSFILWTATIIVLCAILFLSFQDGEAAKNVDNVLIKRFAEWYYNRNDFNVFEIIDINYRFRQYGRIIIFMILGFLGTATIHSSFYKTPWLLRTFVAGILLISVAIFTEKYKIYLPTRHFSKIEMMYSIYGAFLSFVFVSFITFVFTVVGETYKFIVGERC